MFTVNAKFIIWVFSMLCMNSGLAVTFGQFEHDFDEKPWLELQSHLPSYPQNADLLAFAVSAANANRFYVDAKSINVGADGVVRYVLVIKTPGGAVNVSFEGMRCDKRMVKRYAHAASNGTWSKARDPKWSDIVYKDYNRQHNVLYDDFFCPRNIIIAKPEEAINALKY